MNRSLFTLLIFISGCIALQTDDTSKPSIESPVVLSFENIFGFGVSEMETPEEIPTSTLPHFDVFRIDTRVVIEGQPIPVQNVKGHDTEGMWWAKNMEDVLRDLANAEALYKDVSLKFHISEVSFKEWQPNVIHHFLQANVHDGVMTIVYMLPNSFPHDGYSSAPWERFNRGIVVNYLADEWTVAHEIGHYFGLLHTFANFPEGDFVSDTAEQDTKFCAGELNSTPNCRNIMQYCNHGPKELTPGQIERMQRFLRAKRLDHLVREKTDITLRGSSLPELPGLKVMFNLDFGGKEFKVKREIIETSP